MTPERRAELKAYADYPEVAELLAEIDRLNTMNANLSKATTMAVDELDKRDNLVSVSRTSTGMKKVFINRILEATRSFLFAIIVFASVANLEKVPWFPAVLMFGASMLATMTVLMFIFEGIITEMMDDKK